MQSCVPGQSRGLGKLGHQGTQSVVFKKTGDWYTSYCQDRMLKFFRICLIQNFVKSHKISAHSDNFHSP